MKTDPPRGDSTRVRIQHAAVTSFADKGFHGTSTRDIAAAAGMSSAGMYVHHRSKEELLYEISKAGHETTLRLVRDASATHTDPQEALAQLVHDFVFHHAHAHTTARVINYELASLAPQHYAVIRELRRDIEHEVRRLVTRGVDAGRFDVPDPEILAAALLSLGIDLARWYRDDGRWTPEQIATRYVELALRMAGV